MIREIERNIEFLKQQAETATPKDADVIRDLRDTFIANQERAVGMAANMIGANKRIIVVKVGMIPLIMINPEILEKKNAYQVMEGCLSLFGERETTRYAEIEIQYLDINFKLQKQIFNDFIAEVIQHEIDHTKGIII